MPDAAVSGRIGPNALLQLIPVLERAGGPALAQDLFAAAGVTGPVPDDGLIDEAPVARVHQELRRRLPGEADALARAAGIGTAAYIMANRIPAPVVRLLKALPPVFAAPLLTGAIARHAWTFAGSGRFEVAGRRPLTFLIHDNPVVRGERAEKPCCAWHAAVFEHLYRTLVDDRLRAREAECCAMGATACRFVLSR